LIFAEPPPCKKSPLLPSTPSSGKITDMNATQVKFGHPHTLVAETTHWCILARPQQVTLGALVMAAKSDVHSFQKLTQEAFADMHRATAIIENGLKRFRNYDKMNYLMLMMVDPHVHMHVLPRYATSQEFAGTTFRDAGWPGAPDLSSAPALDPDTFGKLLAALKESFVRA
jgi:diadenosine tetraphosphate (Ap4A) HIT family hydrolase